LVHGAWIDSSCWSLVAAPLRDRGHRVELAELHCGTLAADTRAAQEVVDGLGGLVVVCGWSYGGMVITGLELPPGSHLVYLCAFMPDEGESATSLNLRHPGDVMTVVQGDDAGNTILAGDEIDELVWADAPPDVAIAARASLRPQVLQTMLDTPARVAWRDTPSTYVMTRQDRTLKAGLQREMAPRATHVVEWDTSHSPVLSRPDFVVDLLDSLAS
jgi:pimeloyl-ACP methyl ester carboxylesterase